MRPKICWALACLRSSRTTENCKQGLTLCRLYPSVLRKSAENEIEIMGLCIYIDQRLTPFHFRLQLARSDNSVSWLELKFGESANGELVRMPFSFSAVSEKALHALSHRTNSIVWFYHVGYGERQIADHST